VIIMTRTEIQEHIVSSHPRLSLVALKGLVLNFGDGVSDLSDLDLSLGDRAGDISALDLILEDREVDLSDGLNCGDGEADSLRFGDVANRSELALGLGVHMTEVLKARYMEMNCSEMRSSLKMEIQLFVLGSFQIGLDLKSSLILVQMRIYKKNFYFQTLVLL